MTTKKKEVGEVTNPATSNDRKQSALFDVEQGA
jgi:hypothetical protein